MSMMTGWTEADRLRIARFAQQQEVQTFVPYPGNRLADRQKAEAKRQADIAQKRLERDAAVGRAIGAIGRRTAPSGLVCPF